MVAVKQKQMNPVPSRDEIYRIMLGENNLFHILYGEGTPAEKRKASQLWKKSEKTHRLLTMMQPKKGDFIGKREYSPHERERNTATENPRQVSEQIVRAFGNRQAKSVGNTRTDGQAIYLHGNKIAEWRSDGLWISNAGWFSSTTKERLNALPGVRVHQKQGVWYLNSKDWDGGWVNVDDWTSRNPNIATEATGAVENGKYRKGRSNAQTEDAKGVRYLISRSVGESEESILRRASEFYGVKMVRIVKAKRNATAADFRIQKMVDGGWHTVASYGSQYRAVDELETLIKQGERDRMRVVSPSGKTVASSSGKRNATAADFRQHQKIRLEELAKLFQGEATGEKRRVLESDYTPKKKYRLGHLKLLKIKDGGKIIPIIVDGDEKGVEAYVAADLRNNLLIVGRDARMENIRLPKKGFLRYLGELIQIDYVTAKKHIGGGKLIHFYHKLGEVTGEHPNLFVDDEGCLIIQGGGYDVWDVGIVN